MIGAKVGDARDMRRLLRRLGWHRNPLRRGTDRFEGWLNFVLIMLLLAGGTGLSVAVAGSTYRSQARQVAWERAHRHQVWAMLMEKPAGPTASARWTGPDQVARTGRIPAGPGDTAGTWLQVWVDDRGGLTGPPSRRRPAADAFQAAVASVLALAAALLAVGMAGRRLLDRRRLRAWQSEWMEVGPRWSRYR